MYESEYINKQKIFDAFDEADCDVHEDFADEYCEFGFSQPLVRSIIHELPTVDAVPVVRCEDCTHYDLGICLKIYSDGNAHFEAWQPRYPDDFCSYGVAKKVVDDEKS